MEELGREHFGPHIAAGCDTWEKLHKQNSPTKRRGGSTGLGGGQDKTGGKRGIREGVP